LSRLDICLDGVVCTYVCMYGGEAGGPGYVAICIAICNYYERYMYVRCSWAGYVVVNRYVVSGAPASII
jgi:hypothetical protein